MFTISQSIINRKAYLRHFVIKSLGIDRAVSWTLFNIFLQLIKGPLSVIFIITFLTQEQQGIWYTFLSLAGVSVFAELGFTRIITRFVSHEYAHVEMRNGIIEGEPDKKDSLFSLIHYSIKFYLFIIPLAIIILIGTGFYIFSNDSPVLLLAWIIFSFLTGLKLLGSLFQSIFQGLDKVAVIAKNLFIGSIVTSLMNWILLASGANIWALVVSNATGLIIMILLLYRLCPEFWSQLKLYKCRSKFKWFGKIMPLQWKYALSFIGGYIASQAYIPAIYKIEGTVVAGQFGLSLLVMSVLISAGSAWIRSKTPKLNMMVAKNDKKALDQLFIKSSIRGYLVYILGSASALIFIWMLTYFNVYNGRFLSVSETAILLIGGLANIKVGFLAEYVRAYKAEPFYILSIMVCIIAFILIFFVLPVFGLFTFLVLKAIVEWFVALPIAFILSRKYLHSGR